MSGNRYTEAAEQFFNNSDSDSDDGKAAASSGDDTPEAMANETSDYYIGIGHTKAVATAFVKAHPNLETSWVDKDELHPQVEWMKNLHEVKGVLGDRQSNENPFALGFGADEGYVPEFGNELPTIETEEIDGGILATLKAQEGRVKDSDGEPTYPEGSTDELGQGLPLLIPVVDGSPLPVFVQSDADLEAALDLLQQIPREPPVAEIPEEERTPLEAAAEALDVSPKILNADLEGYPTPTELNVDEIRDLITDLEDITLVHTMLRIEKAMDNRKTAVKALNGRLSRLNSAKDAAIRESKDNDAAAFFDGGNNEQESEQEPDDAPVIDGSKDVGKATKVKMAMSLHEEDGIPLSEAKEMVGL